MFKPTMLYLDCWTGATVPVREWTRPERLHVNRVCDTVVETEDGVRHVVGRVLLDPLPQFSALAWE